MTRRIYGILPWGLIGLGVLHASATFRFYHAPSSAALWFFNGGLLMILGGAVNLLNRAYGALAPGVRWVCRATNVALLGVSAAMAIVTHPGLWSTMFVLGLVGGLLLLSWLPPVTRSGTGGR